MSQRRSQRDEREKRLFEKSLRDHGQVADSDAEELPAGATHKVETGPDGREIVRRKRFSAT